MLLVHKISKVGVLVAGMGYRWVPGSERAWFRLKTVLMMGHGFLTSRFYVHGYGFMMAKPSGFVLITIFRWG